MRNWISRLFDSPDKASAGNASIDIPRSMQQGSEELKQGNYAAAAEIYRQVVASDDSHISAHCNLGFALKELAHFDEAEQALLRAIALDPSLVDAHFLLAEVRHAKGNIEASSGQWRTVLSLAPDCEPAYLALCHLLLEQGRTAEALQLVIDGLAHLPRSANLHFYLGNLQYENQQLPLAAASFHSALAIEPSRAEIWSNLGIAQFRQDHFEDAILSLTRALELNPELIDVRRNLADACFNQGKRQQSQGEMDKAIGSYERALAVHPGHLPSLISLGNAVSAQGRLEDAASVLRSGLQVLPNHPDLLTNLGLVLQTQGRYPDAVECYQAAISASPNHVEARFNLGAALHKQGQYEAAIECYRAILLTNPNHLGSLFNLAHALQHRKERGEAETLFRRILHIDPGHFDASLNLGLVLQDQGRLNDALECFQEALRLNPGDYRALSNIGTILQEQALLDQALATYHEALQADNTSLEVRLNIANLLMSLNRYDEAIAFCDAVLEFDSSDAHARLCKAYCMLALGEYEKAWRDYEYRWQCTDEKKPSFFQPEWDGESDLSGKTVLLYAEQGLGDTLQFIRYAPLLARRGAIIHALVPKALDTLIARCSGVAKVFTSAQDLVQFDYHCAMMSLPLLCGTTLQNLPPDIPYLAGSPEKQRLWLERVTRKTASRAALRVGLVWAGNPRKHLRNAQAVDRMRSLEFEQITPLLDVDGVEFFSVQLGEDAVRQLNGDPRVIDLTAELHDFDDTAAFISNLDLIISVDTSVVHLTGALGKPVWVLNRYNTCWRWLTTRDDSPWYPTARLFRQPVFGDWGSVITEVRQALSELTATARPRNRE